MKTTYLKFIALFSISVIVSCGTTKTAAERQLIANSVSEKIKNMNFVFKPDYVIPSRFQSITLSPDYWISITKDTINSNLPFYGVAYRAPLNTQEAAYRFISTDFVYEIKNRSKKGCWFVKVVTKDTRGRYEFLFDIWDNASASLTIIDTDRSTINFQGKIDED